MMVFSIPTIPVATIPIEKAIEKSTAISNENSFNTAKDSTKSSKKDITNIFPKDIRF
jgi:hypothetical protein